MPESSQMTHDQLVARCKSLTEYAATLDHLAYWEDREQVLLRKIAHFQTEAMAQNAALDAANKSDGDHARYVLARIAESLVLAETLIPNLPVPDAVRKRAVLATESFQKIGHFAEVAAYDKRAKEFFAGIVRTLVDLANQTRTKDRKIDMPSPDSPRHTDLCIHWTEYVEEYGEHNRRIEYLESRLKSYMLAAPPTPPDWNPGVMPAHSNLSVYTDSGSMSPEEVAAAATLAANGITNPAAFSETLKDKMPGGKERIPNGGTGEG